VNDENDIAKNEI